MAERRQHQNCGDTEIIDKHGRDQPARGIARRVGAYPPASNAKGEQRYTGYTCDRGSGRIEAGAEEQFDEHCRRNQQRHSGRALGRSHHGKKRLRIYEPRHYRLPLSLLPELEGHFVDRSRKLERGIVAVFDERNSGAGIEANIKTLILGEGNRNGVIHGVAGNFLAIY